MCEKWERNKLWGRQIERGRRRKRGREREGEVRVLVKSLNYPVAIKYGSSAPIAHIYIYPVCAGIYMAFTLHTHTL